MPYNPETEIGNLALKPENYLVLHFSPSSSAQRVSGDTVRNKDSQLYFFQVVDTSWLSYKPLLLRDSDGNEVGPIEPGEGVDYNQLYDGDGDDILRIPDEPWRIYHFSLGVRQPGVRVYPRVPDSINGGGFDWLSGSEPTPEDGDDVGYISSGDTNYGAPSTKLEQFAYHTDDLTQIQYGFYNESDTVAKKPVLSVAGYGYELRPVFREKDMLEILAQLGKRPGDRDVAVHTASFTPNSLRSFSYNIPSEWDNAENNLEVTDTNLPRTIEEELGIYETPYQDEQDDDDTDNGPELPRVES